MNGVHFPFILKNADGAQFKFKFQNVNGVQFKFKFQNVSGVQFKFDVGTLIDSRPGCRLIAVCSRQR